MFTADGSKDGLAAFDSSNGDGPWCLRTVNAEDILPTSCLWFWEVKKATNNSEERRI